MGKKIQWNFLWITLLILGIIGTLARHDHAIPYRTISELVLGTVHNITYQYDSDLKSEIGTGFKRLSGSLSPSSDTATITRTNRDEDIVPSAFFINVFRRSMGVSQGTGGAFNITVTLLTNAQGFGFKKGVFPDSAMIDNLLDIVGYSKVSLSAEGKAIKQDPRIMFPCSTVAKGYAVDVITRLLEKRGIGNLMVDIGGEIVVREEDPKKSLWCIGINKPADNSLAVNRELQTILQVTNMGVTTSDNYRNYYYKDGEKHAHTADPRTGYSIQYNTLLTAVTAWDCMSADAYATALMVTGLEEAERSVNTHPDLNACFAYTGDKGEFQMFYMEGTNKYIVDK